MGEPMASNIVERGDPSLQTRHHDRNDLCGDVGNGRFHYSALYERQPKRQCWAFDFKRYRPVAFYPSACANGRGIVVHGAYYHRDFLRLVDIRKEL